MLSYKCNVKEMFFIRQGVVEVLNPDHDHDNKIDDIDPAPMKQHKAKEQPILYLPKYSYFGDYQILYNLKSNIIF